MGDDFRKRFIFVTRKYQVYLVRCNSYYTVIGISIIMIKISYNVITIIIHLFGDNTLM